MLQTACAGKRGQGAAGGKKAEGGPSAATAHLVNHGVDLQAGGSAGCSDGAWQHAADRHPPAALPHTTGRLPPLPPQVGCRAPTPVPHHLSPLHPVESGRVLGEEALAVQKEHHALLLQPPLRAEGVEDLRARGAGVWGAGRLRLVGKGVGQRGSAQRGVSCWPATPHLLERSVALHPERDLVAVLACAGEK